jgi:hypothetical protein
MNSTALKSQNLRVPAESRLELSWLMNLSYGKKCDPAAVLLPPPPTMIAGLAMASDTPNTAGLAVRNDHGRQVTAVFR